MTNPESVALKRDCRAVQIPFGNTIVIPQGTEVTITQSLGESFTVNVAGNLARIEGTDADAYFRGTPLDRFHVHDDVSAVVPFPRVAARERITGLGGDRDLQLPQGFPRGVPHIIVGRAHIHVRYPLDVGVGSRTGAGGRHRDAPARPQKHHRDRYRENPRAHTLASLRYVR